MDIPLQFRIFTPDGREFTATEVTLADLQKFRDLRGTPSGLWSYKVTGESEHFVLEKDESITNAKGVLGIGLDETVRTESAPPLVPNALVSLSSQTFSFDLFRVGVFVAELSHASPFASWQGTMRLIDPDGQVVARTSARTLRFSVSLATLGKSRDSAGKVRKWKLDVLPQAGVGDRGFRISATVIGSARLKTALLKSRIDGLIGPRGRFIKLFGENKDGQALARLIITDTVAAETIDMHGLLEKPLEATAQDGNADPDNVQANTLYTLGRRSEKLGFGTTLEVKTLKVGAIDVAIGPGVRLGASVPAVRLTVEVSGQAKIKLGPATIAEAGVRGGKLEMEVGIKLGPDGTPQIVTWIPDEPFDVDLHWGVVLGLGVIAGPLLAAGSGAVIEHIEHVLNEQVGSGARELFANPALAPTILMSILGAHLTYRPIRFEGSDIVFDHIAPLEPDPAPRPGYSGVIGRSMSQLGPGLPRFTPLTLGDTWAADNLAKIDHIVVVMMENRSYDHVLG